MRPNSGPKLLMPFGKVIVLAYPGFLLVLSLVQVVFPQRNGPLAFSQIFAPYLFLPLLLLLPLAFGRKTLALRLLLVVCALVWLGRFMPPLHLTTPQVSPGATQLSVLTWNLLYDGASAEAQTLLRSRPADIVALQESYGEWLADDEVIARHYPYQLRFERHLLRDLVLLSAYPIIASSTPNISQDSEEIAQLLWAKVDLGGGRSLTVFNGHPYRPRAWRLGCPEPFCFDTSQRDAHIRQIRPLIERAMQEGQSVLVLGDFNVTEREPAYRDLSKGLIDVYRAVGSGAGSSWKPSLGRWQVLPVLRIDYLLVSPNIRPLQAQVDCRHRRSDHCMLRGQFEL